MALTKVREAGYNLTTAKLPSGSVIQVVSHSITSGASTGSSSAVALVTLGSITTTRLNSKIIVSSTLPTQISTASNGRGVFGLRSSVDSYSSSLETHVSVNYAEGSNGWVQLDNNFFALHNPSQASGTTITYKMYASANQGSNAVYMLDSWGQSTNHAVVLQEIVG